MKTKYSFEVLPPLKGTGTKNLFNTIDILSEFKPELINITTHRSEYVYMEQADGTYVKNRLRRRPGTIAVASAIMHRYNLKVVPHVLCSGFSCEDTEYMLLDLQFLGIKDILILRGDKAPDDKRFVPEKNGHSHATELIEQVNQFNAGKFLDGSDIKVPGEPFEYGVACYPEKHDEAPNMEFDLRVLKQKQDLGAKYAVTQLFFDNKKYFEFVEMARKSGITIPIIPGIKPLAKKSQIGIIPKTFHVDIPKELADEANKLTTDEDVARLGVEWCVAQCKELINAGVPRLHFYTVSAVPSIKEIIARL
ncbi:MAG: methylenetetrahydrofolate reductase [Bacteroidaceae bacterium]|nr:methylenetetrahydrofolate reductase [Bacteroidaceae bacterium]